MKKPFIFPVLLAMFSLVLTGAVASRPLYKKTIPAPSTETLLKKMTDDIFRLVNEHRVAMGLPALIFNATAAEQALQHSSRMSMGEVAFGHDGFDDRMAVISQSEGHLRSTAENVASGHMSAAEVVEGWLNSPGHRRNIEGNFTHTGIGLAKASDGHIYFTQIFYR